MSFLDLIVCMLQIYAKMFERQSFYIVFVSVRIYKSYICTIITFSFINEKFFIDFTIFLK